MVRDMGVPGVLPTDRRQLEIVATGLPLEQGLPMAVDATMVSPLHGDGSAWVDADRVPGISLG